MSACSLEGLGEAGFFSAEQLPGLEDALLPFAELALLDIEAADCCLSAPTRNFLLLASPVSDPSFDPDLLLLESEVAVELPLPLFISWPDAEVAASSATFPLPADASPRRSELSAGLAKESMPPPFEGVDAAASDNGADPSAAAVVKVDDAVATVTSG